MSRQSANVVKSRDIEHDSACDDRRNGCRITFSYAKISTPILLLKPVVPMVVVTHSYMCKAIDLCRNVVTNENGRAVPTRQAGIYRGQGEWLILLCGNTSWASKRHDLGRTMPRPFVTVSVIRNAQVVRTALGGDFQRRQRRFFIQCVQSADFVVLAPNPAPTDSLFPTGD